jgi:sugar transferase EpsL
VEKPASVLPEDTEFQCGIERMIAKRILDITLSAAFLIFFLPLLLILAAVVYFKLGRPILYRQMRPGLHGKPFALYKFRTMGQQRDATGRLLPDAQRLNTFGRFLRATSLDELPEFWNVMRGDMSLVGPRPLLMQYLDRYTPEQFRRHERLPGITGWAQVNGRNALSWEKRFQLDVWYVDNWSFWLDFRILILTIVKMFKSEGITAEGHATMPEFIGSNKPENK